MILLGARLYDPAVAVNKVTTAALAMTALDTTNLRIAFTIPSHGFVRVRLSGTIHGATTFPSILLGVMSGAAVVARVAPTQELGNTAVATALVKVTADFCIPGLTPGAVTWDAAYAVETLVAATGLKYGGPNDTTANNAFGAFAFEVWDPNSVSSVTGSVGSVTSPVTAGTVSDKTGYSISTLPAIPANWLTSVGIAASALNGKGDWNIGKTGYALTQAFPTNFNLLSVNGSGFVTTTGGTGSDPLNNVVPGAYAAGTAGYVLGNVADKVHGFTP